MRFVYESLCQKKTSMLCSVHAAVWLEGPEGKMLPAQTGSQPTCYDVLDTEKQDFCA